MKYNHEIALEKQMADRQRAMQNSSLFSDDLLADLKMKQAAERAQYDNAKVPWPTDHIDPVNHPRHYTSHPSGIECIQITEHMSFTLGNAVKYLWRADLKGESVQDLEKAIFYIKREIALRKGTQR